MARLILSLKGLFMYGSTKKGGKKKGTKKK